jgi:hypothetical protein
MRFLVIATAIMLSACSAGPEMAWNKAGTTRQERLAILHRCDTDTKVAFVANYGPLIGNRVHHTNDEEEFSRCMEAYGMRLEARR